MRPLERTKFFKENKSEVFGKAVLILSGTQALQSL
jgi:hypothetical protein